jgi:D-glycero-alpha-D-manno-heptose-7-phosphate kinase
MIISKTPYRLPLSGGGTDIKFYYSKNNSEFISSSINEYVYVLLSHRKIDNNFLIQTTSTQFSTSLSDINHDLIRETLKYFKISEKLHIGTYSTVPTRTGLGTSSAMVVGLINCINKFKNFKLNKKKIYEIAYKIERNICRIQGGWQDQIVSTYGGAIHARITRKEKIFIKKFRFSNNLKKIINNNFILVYTNTKRDSSEVIKSQFKNQNNSIKFYDQIKLLNKKMVDFVKDNNIEQIGKLFSNHWNIKKKLSNKMTDAILESFYKKLEKNISILGSKLIGAGGGGFFLICVKNKKNVIQVLKSKKINFLDLRYESKGSLILNL